ncbi:T9SS type A sorting domain-containing protein, partial [candidate division WOR-3 bacterium]|nr:T9SS type A sorting domain-containing protein [candidate division WOR-3 bacterium]
KVEFLLYNVNGQLIRRMPGNEVEVGEHTVTWDLKDDKGLTVSPGVYFLELRATEGGVKTKIVVTR